MLDEELGSYQRIQALVSTHLSHSSSPPCSWLQPNGVRLMRWPEAAVLLILRRRLLNPMRAPINQPINHHLVTVLISYLPSGVKLHIVTSSSGVNAV